MADYEVLKYIVEWNEFSKYEFTSLEDVIEYVNSVKNSQPEKEPIIYQIRKVIL